MKIWRLIRYDWPTHLMLAITNWLPDNVVFLRLRGWLVGRFLGKAGRDLRLGRNVTFYNPSEIEIGSNVYIAYGCWFMAGEKIAVRDQVLFGPYCVVVSSDHTKVEGSYRYGPPNRAPITVGAGSWIAAHVTITAGSSIGDGCVVGAGSVVRGQFPPGVMIVGQPARVIRTKDGG
jgi:maltose O-acetyltransferase